MRSRWSHAEAQWLRREIVTGLAMSLEGTPREQRLRYLPGAIALVVSGVTRRWPDMSIEDVRRIFCDGDGRRPIGDEVLALLERMPRGSDDEVTQCPRSH